MFVAPGSCLIATKASKSEGMPRSLATRYEVVVATRTGICRDSIVRVLGQKVDSHGNDGREDADQQAHEPKPQRNAFKVVPPVEVINEPIARAAICHDHAGANPVGTPATRPPSTPRVGNRRSAIGLSMTRAPHLRGGRVGL